MVDWGFKWQLLAIFGGQDVQLFWAACSLGRRKNNEIGIDRLYKGWYSKCFLEGWGKPWSGVIFSIF
jgi:hypothetical protein